MEIIWKLGIVNNAGTCHGLLDLLVQEGVDEHVGRYHDHVQVSGEIPVVRIHVTTSTEALARAANLVKAKERGSFLLAARVAAAKLVAYRV